MKKVDLVLEEAGVRTFDGGLLANYPVTMFDRVVATSPASLGLPGGGASSAPPLASQALS